MVKQHRRAETVPSRSAWFRHPLERNLWLCAVAVQLGIWATLPLAGKLATWLDGWFPLEMAFLAAFLLLMAAVVWGALRRSARWRDLWIVAALVAVATLLATRTGIPLAERSHLIEYGLVAVLIYHALLARRAAGGAVRGAAAIAVTSTAALGAVDEAIQAALPNRVFDPRDLLFNALAACMTVGITVVLRGASSWLSGRSRSR